MLKSDSHRRSWGFSSCPVLSLFGEGVLTLDRLACSSGDISSYHVRLEPAHTILAQACLGVLLRMDDRVNPKTLGDTPLVEYAARHWVDHAQFKNVSPYIRVAMEYLFDVERPHYAAWLRVHGDTAVTQAEARRRFLDPLLAHLDQAGLGHISEIADAEPPFTPRGCPFQAWSLGELLRLERAVLA